MTRIERLERAVASLSPEELAQFGDWFVEFDWAKWDRQLERDSEAGKPERLSEQALRDHEAGRTTPL